MLSIAAKLQALVRPERWCAAAYDLDQDAAKLRARRYGTIVISAGKLERIVLRPWPKLVSLPEVWWSDRQHSGQPHVDQCRLYYDQPWGMPNFLAIKYVVSSPGATYQSFFRAMQVIDAIACIKRTDAMVCEASNLRISDRLAQRWGWERHCLQSSRRHFIKRFYGVYPPRFDAHASLASEPAEQAPAASLRGT